MYSCLILRVTSGTVAVWQGSGYANLILFWIYNDRYARADYSSSSCATGSRIESSVVSARIRAWLSLRGLFVGDVISRLSRFLGRSFLLPTSSQVSIREACVRRGPSPQ